MLIRDLTDYFNARILKLEQTRRPTSTSMAPVAPVSSTSPESRPRHRLDRRSGIDRRQQQNRVLLDLRSPHARRQSTGRRYGHDAVPEPSPETGIDVYT